MLPIIGRCLIVVAALCLLSACSPRQQHPLMVKLEARLAAMPAPKPPYHEGLIYKSTWFDDLRLDLYLPYNHDTNTNLKHPVYVHVHGGSWLFGNRKHARLGEALIESLREQGIAVISIDYRKLNEAGFVRMVEDAQDSLQWLVDNADKYQLDPARVVLHGPSAGGHLVLMMGFTETIPALEIKLILDEYGPADLLAMRERAFNGGRNFIKLWPAFRLRKVSPIEFVRKGLPPVSIIHGELDELVPLSQSDSLARALRETGNSVEYEIITGASHGLLNVDKNTRQQLSKKRLHQILRALQPD